MTEQPKNIGDIIPPQAEEPKRLSDAPEPRNSYDTPGPKNPYLRE